MLAKFQTSYYCIIYVIFMHVSISGEMVKIDKVKNYKYVGRTVFEATYLGWVQCVELCSRMSVCKSMNYLAVGKICQINSDAPSDFTALVKDNTGNIFMLAEVSNKVRIRLKSGKNFLSGKVSSVVEIVWWFYFTTTCTISAYHHESCEFEPGLW